MKRKLMRGYILLALVCAIYSIALVPFPKDAVWGTVLVYSVMAVLVQGYVLHVIFRTKALIKDRIYDFPTLRISVLYLVVQLAVSLVLLGFAHKIPYYAVLLVETVIVAIAAAGFYGAQAARAEIDRQDGQMHDQLAWMRAVQARVEVWQSRCGEGEIGQVLQKLSEEIRYSNPVSSDISEEVEEEIEGLLREAEAAALEEDVEAVRQWCGQITDLLRERDRIRKYGG